MDAVAALADSASQEIPELLCSIRDGEGFLVQDAIDNALDLLEGRKVKSESNGQDTEAVPTDFAESSLDEMWKIYEATVVKDLSLHEEFVAYRSASRRSAFSFQDGETRMVEATSEMPLHEALAAKDIALVDDASSNIEDTDSCSEFSSDSGTSIVSDARDLEMQRLMSKYKHLVAVHDAVFETITCDTLNEIDSPSTFDMESEKTDDYSLESLKLHGRAANAEVELQPSSQSSFEYCAVSTPSYRDSDDEATPCDPDEHSSRKDSDEAWLVV